MSIRRTSVASERSSLMSAASPKQEKTHPADHADREGKEEEEASTPPAKRAAASSTHSKAKASSPKQSRKYAPSMTSSQMTYETMDYTNDSASTRTAQRETPQQQPTREHVSPEKLPLHPKVVPTNQDLRRSHMIDRYAGMRDPSFFATYDLSEIAAQGDKAKGSGSSVFSLSSKKKKKTYDVAVTNPLIAAREAQDSGRSASGGGAGGGGGGGGGLGGLFRRQSKSSARSAVDIPDQSSQKNAGSNLLDESRDKKQLLEEAERQAAWEAQEKERKEAEEAQRRAQQKIDDQKAREQRKKEAAEAKERRRVEKEQQKEAKRQSKLAAATAAPPPQYSAAAAAGGGGDQNAPPEAKDEEKTASQIEGSEGHRIGDEVPTTAQSPREGQFNEEFSVVEGQGEHHRDDQSVSSSDVTSDDSSEGSSITEEAAPRGDQAAETDQERQGAATPVPVAQSTDAAGEVAQPGSAGKTYADAGVQTLVDSSAQTDPVEFASPSDAAPAPATPAPPPPLSARASAPPAARSTPSASADKLQFKEPAKTNRSSTTGAAAVGGVAAAGAGGGGAAVAGSGGGGLKGLFRRLSRSKSNKQESPRRQSAGGAAAPISAPAGAASTTDSKAGPAGVAPPPGKSTTATQMDDAKSMVTLDSMWVKPPKKSRTRSVRRKAALVGPATALYHEGGVMDTLYPEPAPPASQKPDDAKSMATMATLDSMWVHHPPAKPAAASTHTIPRKQPIGPATALYHEAGTHDTLYPSVAEETNSSAPEAVSEGVKDEALQEKESRPYSSAAPAAVTETESADKDGEEVKDDALGGKESRPYSLAAAGAGAGAAGVAGAAAVAGGKSEKDQAKGPYDDTYIPIHHKEASPIDKAAEAQGDSATPSSNLAAPIAGDESEDQQHGLAPSSKTGEKFDPLAPIHIYHECGLRDSIYPAVASS